MNKIIVSFVSLLVGLGLGYVVFHNGANQPAPVGGLYENYPSHFTNGLYAGGSDQLSIDSSGSVASSGTVNATTVKASVYSTATIGASSSSPAALGSAASGHFVIAAGATSLVASTTAVTANSAIHFTRELTTPIAGTTCNSTVSASSTVAATAVAGSGFVATVANAPVTNPFCFSYRIVN